MQESVSVECTSCCKVSFSLQPALAIFARRKILNELVHEIAGFKILLCTEDFFYREIDTINWI